MVGFGRRHHQGRGERSGEEDGHVRQYRFLLRQAPPDAVEAAHSEALTVLRAEERQTVLSAVQQGLLAGQRLRSEDVSQIAHLIVLGERRTPNAFLSACEGSTLVALARAVVDSDATSGLFGPYATWDGADPTPVDPAEEEAFAKPGRWGSAGAPSKDGAGGYPGGFPGGRLPPSSGRR